MEERGINVVGMSISPLDDFLALDSLKKTLLLIVM